MSDKKPFTKVTYRYRDASNYKAVTEIVIIGNITPEQAHTIMDCCQNDGDCLQFVPEAIGLPLCRPGVYNEQDDHPWAYFDMLRENNFHATAWKPDINIRVEDFVKLFTENKNNWEKLAEERERAMEQRQTPPTEEDYPYAGELEIPCGPRTKPDKSSNVPTELNLLSVFRQTIRDSQAIKDTTRDTIDSLLCTIQNMIAEDIVNAKPEA